MKSLYTLCFDGKPALKLDILVKMRYKFDPSDGKRGEQTRKARGSPAQEIEPGSTGWALKI